MSPFTLVHPIIGPSDPYEPNNERKSGLLHAFYSYSQLRLHLVVLHRVEHFLWIGAISKQTQAQLNLSQPLYFASWYEQIFDPFHITLFDGIRLPNAPGHFLSQLPTSRYLSCDPELNTAFLEQYQLEENRETLEASYKSLLSMRSLMKASQMQFWLSSGTLLGWKRQCSVIPFTDDSDFATWSKYAIHPTWPSLTAKLLNLAPKVDLKLKLQIGTPSTNVEYSFNLKDPKYDWKIDLFFNYPNETHYRFPLHGVGAYTYQILPKFELCSVELHGYKVLAPCTAEEVIKTGKLTSLLGNYQN